MASFFKSALSKATYFGNLEAYLDHFDLVLLSGFIALLKDLGVTFVLDLLDLC